MHADLNAQLAAAKQQVEQWKDLKASLPAAQERLSHENFRLHQVEASLSEIEEQIGALESFSLSNLLDSLMGRKEVRLAERRGELERLQGERDHAAEALMRVDGEVREIERQLTRLSDAHQVLQQLCDQKQAEILEVDCEAAERLRGLLAAIEGAKTKKRELLKTIQIGKHVLDRLQTMAGAIGRAKSKMTLTAPLGAVGATAMNTLARQGTAGHIERVREKLGELGRCIAALDLGGKTELDVEIAQLGTAMECWQHNLDENWAGRVECDRAAALPVMEQVIATIGHLESKVERINPEIGRLEYQRLLLIEGM